MTTIKLPQNVEQSIESLLKESNSSEWLKSAVSLSLKYRAERVKQGITYIKDYSDALGYLALRTPSTYAQIYGALTAVKEVNPSWNPKTVLDIGSGPGTASWAATEIFSSIKEITNVEQDKNFISIGKNILHPEPLLTVEWHSTNLTFSLPHTTKKFDLVILANVLNEMDNATRQKTVEFAYKHCQGTVVIIEPGTPFGNESISQAVTELEKYNPKIIAPFVENTFYSAEEIIFSQRVIRPEFQKRIRQLQRKMDLKDKTKILPPSDWEDATYCYIAFSKSKPEIQPQARLIKQPQLFKPFIELYLLTKDGIKKERILKKNKTLFKQCKKLRVGDIVTLMTDS